MYVEVNQEKGDFVMVDLFDASKVVARKEYKCALCGGFIHKGSLYSKWKYLAEGEFREDKYHDKCATTINSYIDETGNYEFFVDDVLDWYVDADMEIGE